MPKKKTVNLTKRETAKLAQLVRLAWERSGQELGTADLPGRRSWCWGYICGRARVFADDLLAQDKDPEDFGGFEGVGPRGGTSV